MKTFASPPNRRTTLILLAMCCLLAMIAAALGVDDNPPGVLCAYLAALTFVLAFVHPWRTARQFGWLVFMSVAGFALFIILDILFEEGAHTPEPMGTLQMAWQGFADAAFLLGALIFPAAFIVGVVGLVVVYIRGHRPPSPRK